jgi:hypothetical protein
MKKITFQDFIGIHPDTSKYATLCYLKVPRVQTHKAAQCIPGVADRGEISIEVVTLHNLSVAVKSI